ncbi:cytochrome P450 82A2-like [Vigna umbellata]|uniref:cytochrome P450 82A2-like n=1 Tax=Vigna umbellata TaxID=87088 RepID=UPI001F5FBB23|nr:cytochrome P450 82A2-like [Vigna umbellata]
MLRRRRTGTGETREAPPEVSGAWPLIGHLHLLSGSKAPHITLGNMADKYGPIFTLRLGVHRNLIVSNWEMAQQCFTVNDKAFANRPKTLAFEVLGYNFSMVGFSPYCSYWRHIRKILTQELLSTQRVDELKHVMESELKVTMKENYDIWQKRKINGSEKATTEMKRWFGDITLNIVFRAMVGKRFVGENDSENERIQKILNDYIHLAGSFTVSDALPYLRWLDLDGEEQKMKKTIKELDGLAQVWLEQHKSNRKSDSGNGDFMDVLLRLVEEGEEFEGRDADITIKATVLGLILAATDTSTGTLTWALALLVNNPEILNKATEELDREIGMGKMVDISDLKKLEYMQCIITESLRLYPPAPLNLIHESMEECSVGGYHVAKGTRLLTNISKLQRDPFIYPHPSEFRPERFLTTHKDVDMKGQHFELIPFGAGRRMCPGLYFGFQVMQLTLATLLHVFHIATPDGKPVDMLERVGLTNIKASPLQLILTPRLSSHIYHQI